MDAEIVQLCPNPMQALAAHLQPLGAQVDACGLREEGASSMQGYQSAMNLRSSVVLHKDVWQLVHFPSREQTKRSCRGALACLSC